MLKHRMCYVYLALMILLILSWYSMEMVYRMGTVIQYRDGVMAWKRNTIEEYSGIFPVNLILLVAVSVSKTASTKF